MREVRHAHWVEEVVLCYGALLELECGELAMEVFIDDGNPSPAAVAVEFGGAASAVMQKVARAAASASGD